VQTQRALGAMLVPLFFVAAFAACIIGSYHKPHPDGIKLGVAGPPAATAQLRAPCGGVRVGLRHQPGPDSRAGHAGRARPRSQRGLRADR
jgi:hypothetical protein